jgi:hypothetical protein
LLHEWLAAVAAIQDADIDARLTKGATTLIVGGKRVGDFVGYPLYRDAFNISCESSGLVPRVECGGQLVNELPVAHLASAVDELVRLRRPTSAS